MSASKKAKAKALVIGASGFLGSHLVKELIRQGHTVRVMARKTSNLKALNGLVYEKAIGDVMDVQALQDAMAGCDWVFHSAVDTRAWLFNSAPLYETNVLGLMNSVKAAQSAGIEKFVLTSSLLTIGRSQQGMADESCYPTSFITDYMRTRFLAEKHLLDTCKASNFPGVACCVANTYGADDFQPTPHGNLVRLVALGRLPVYLRAHSECVGVVDAAKALILAAEKGRNGERYIVSERYLSNKALFTIAAQHAGRKPPAIAIPTWLVNISTVVNGMLMRMLGIDSQLTPNSAKLMYQTWPLDHSKAINELGWQPSSIETAIEQAVDSYRAQ